MKRLFFAVTFATLVNASETPAVETAAIASETSKPDLTLFERCKEAQAVNPELATSDECVEALKAVISQVFENTPALETPAKAEAIAVATTEEAK